MKHNLMISYLSIVALFLSAVTLSAQSETESDVPRAISYQGKISLRDGSPPPDGTYAITVSLFTDMSGDQVVWKETITTPVIDGIFNLYLGRGDVPLPSSGVMNRQLWIGTSIDEMEIIATPSPLTATPYALNIPNYSVSTSKLADDAVTAEKVQMDYIAAFKVNGEKVSGNGTILDFRSGDDISLTYNEESHTISIDKATTTNSSKNDDPTTLGGPTDAWAMRGDGVTPAGASSASTNADWIGTKGNVNFTIKVNDNGAATGGNGRIMQYLPNATSANILGGHNSNAIVNGHGNTIAGGGSNGLANTIDDGSDFGVIGGGNDNSIGEEVDHSTIGGGTMNSVDSKTGTIGGGAENSILEYSPIPAVFNEYSTIGGGYNNTVSGSQSVIAGGAGNIIEGGARGSSIGGGISNEIAPNNHATISGGFDNRVEAANSSIGGGSKNLIANGIGATIAGGTDNEIGSNFSTSTIVPEDATIAGGNSNTIIHGFNAFIGGGKTNSIGLDPGDDASNSLIAGGSSNSIGGNAFDVSHSSIVGGTLNSILGRLSFIGGGYDNDVETYLSTIAGGNENTIYSTSVSSFIGGGSLNDIHSASSFVGGGVFNKIMTDAQNSVIVGGHGNSVVGPTGGLIYNAAIVGGETNSVQAENSTITGGKENLIDEGLYSAFIGGGERNTIVLSTSSNDIIGSAIVAGHDNLIGANAGLSSIGGGSWNKVIPEPTIFNPQTLSASIPGGDNLIAQSYAQTVIGSYNVAKGAMPARYIGSAPNDEPILIIGNGDHNQRSNAFEISYNGHSVVYDQNGTGSTAAGGRAAIRGATYIDNVVYAWADVNANGNVNCDFGVGMVTKVGPGHYRVVLNLVKPENDGTFTPMNLDCASVTASIVAPGRVCATINTTPIAGNTFDVYTTDVASSCSHMDYPFTFKVTGVPASN